MTTIKVSLHPVVSRYIAEDARLFLGCITTEEYLAWLCYQATTHGGDDLRVTTVRYLLERRATVADAPCGRSLTTLSFALFVSATLLNARMQASISTT